MQLTSGSKLQDNLFEITGNIATGGFSYIYTGTWHVKQNADVAGNRVTHVFQHPIVIKELFKSKLARRLKTGWVEWSDSDSEIIKRKTLSEARKLNAIDHPNVLKVYAAFEENNTVYIITKPVENAKVLADIQKLYIKKKDPDTGKDSLYDNPYSVALSVELVNKYTKQLCEALAFVHKSGILHLDVKPDNILVDGNDNIVLIDFGISISIDTKKSSDFVAARTKHYSPPEQGIGKSTSLSIATDVYALGATVYVFLTGKEPPDYEEQLAGTEFLVLPSTLSSNASEYMDGVIMRAMDLNRSQRFQSVEEFYRAFTGETEFNELIAKARKLIQDKKPEKAKAILETASTLVGNHSLLDQLTAQCNSLSESDDQKDQFDQLLSEAEKHFSQSRYENAKAAYSQALSIYPGNTTCRLKIQECEKKIELAKTNEQYNSLFEKARQHQQSENYNEAIAFYEKSLSNQPGDLYAKQGIDECRRLITDAKFNIMFVKASDYDNNRNWEDAISKYKQALEIKPGNNACLAGIRNCEQQKQKSNERTGGTDLITYNHLLTQAKSHIVQGRKNEAINSLNNAINNFPPAYDAKKLLQTIEKQSQPGKSGLKKILIWSSVVIVVVVAFLVITGVIVGPSYKQESMVEPLVESIVNDSVITDTDLGTYKYTGNVLNGIPNYGAGTAIWEAGDEKGNLDKYEGGFVQGKLHGSGKLTKNSSNLIYEGDFVLNQFTGKGRIETIEKTDKANGLIYGLYQLENIDQLKSGVLYVGSFTDYKMDGEGKVYDKDSKLLGNCRFKMDQFDGYISK